MVYSTDQDPESRGLVGTPKAVLARTPEIGPFGAFWRVLIDTIHYEIRHTWIIRDIETVQKWQKRTFPIKPENTRIYTLFECSEGSELEV